MTGLVIFLGLVGNLVGIILSGTALDPARQDWSVLMGTLAASPAIYIVMMIWTRAGRD
jgi:hypothetical protein